MTKEETLWIISSNIINDYGYAVDNISLHIREENFNKIVRIYTSEGYCWEIKKLLITHPAMNRSDSKLLATKEDYKYHFIAIWDAKKGGIEKAIETLEPYGSSEDNERRQLDKIVLETHKVHKWECPCCTESHFSEEEESIEEFTKNLYGQGVRFKIMKHMQGVFCKDCWSDPEVQDSTL